MSETTVARKRPSRSDEDILAVAIDAIVPEVERWSGSKLSVEEIADCRDLLRSGLLWHSNGYEFARDFDRRGWTPDSELVDILENADTKLYHALRAAEEAWLTASQARPALTVGTKVVLPPEQENAGWPGEIVRINETAGTYTVFVESLGHVRDGLGCTGRLFTWEMLERANPAAASGAAT